METEDNSWPRGGRPHGQSGCHAVWVRRGREEAGSAASPLWAWEELHSFLCHGSWCIVFIAVQCDLKNLQCWSDHGLWEGPVYAQRLSEEAGMNVGWRTELFIQSGLPSPQTHPRCCLK